MHIDVNIYYMNMSIILALLRKSSQDREAEDIKQKKEALLRK